MQQYKGETHTCNKSSGIWSIYLLWLLSCIWHFPSAQQQFVIAFTARKIVSGRLSDARSATAGRCHLQILLTFLLFICIFLLCSPQGKVENGLKLIELTSFGKSAEIYIFHKTTNEMHAGYSLQRDSENRNAQMQIFPDYRRIKFLHLVCGSFHCEAQ